MPASSVLDGDSTEILGIGFAGIKGFAGGFGRRALGPWGEDIIKKFVHEAVGEALKLESALARLRTEKRIAVLHYSPIQETVEGEPLEIFPFLGCSRLEEPLGAISGNRCFSRPRASRTARRPHGQGRAGVQRVDDADERTVSRAAVPGDPDRHRCRPTQRRVRSDRRVAGISADQA